MTGITLFQTGKFILNSGKESYLKIECDALSDRDWDGVAAMTRHLIGGPFCEVRGVPRGGIKLADRLAPFAQIGLGPRLIVDDVLTTGGSLERFRTEWRADEAGKGKPISANTFIAVVLFARGQRPHWIKAICQLPEELWLEGVHR